MPASCLKASRAYEQLVRTQSPQVCDRIGLECAFMTLVPDSFAKYATLMPLDMPLYVPPYIPLYASLYAPPHGPYWGRRHAPF